MILIHGHGISLILFTFILCDAPILTLQFRKTDTSMGDSQVAPFVFVTSCDSSRFVELENLIGSIHTHAPTYTVLVYNLGLSGIQLLILDTYWSVRVVSPIWSRYFNGTQQQLDSFKSFGFRAVAMLDALASHERIIYLDARTELIDDPVSVEKVLNKQGYLYIAQENSSMKYPCYNTAEKLAYDSFLDTLQKNNADDYHGKTSCTTVLQGYDKNAGTQTDPYHRQNAIELVLKPAIAWLADFSFILSKRPLSRNHFTDRLLFSILLQKANLSITTDLKLSDSTSRRLNTLQSSAPERFIYHRSHLPIKPYTDLISKRLKLAIIVPFVDKQLDSLIAQLNASTVHLPCATNIRTELARTSGKCADLLLYYSKFHDPSLEKTIQNYISSFAYIQICFCKVRFISANLEDIDDTHPYGANLMWQRLLIESSTNTHLSLRAQAYTHFFWMEPDTKPIRRYWLDALIREIADNRASAHDSDYVVTNWWLRGSIYRGTRDIGDYLLHINGNALYHLSSAYLSYLRLVWRLFPFKERRSEGFDTDQFFYMFGQPGEISREYTWAGSKDGRQLSTKRYWHKFVFSEFIQNCAYTGCSNSIILDSPLTYLVHGSKAISPSSTMTTTTSQRLYLTILILSVIICGGVRLLQPRLLQRIFKRTSLLILSLVANVSHIFVVCVIRLKDRRPGYRSEPSRIRM